MASDEKQPPGVAEVLRFNHEMAEAMNPTLRLQLEADAGAVPGCTTECAKIRTDYAIAEIALRKAHEELITLREERDNAVASLRADAEAVRAVEEWIHAGRRYVRWIYAGKWEAYDYADSSHTFAPDLPTLGRALLARRQEEGQTDNG